MIDPIKDEAMKWIEVHRQKLQSDLLVRILDFESKELTKTQPSAIQESYCQTHRLGTKRRVADAVEPS